MTCFNQIVLHYKLYVVIFEGGVLYIYIYILEIYKPVQANANIRG